MIQTIQHEFKEDKQLQRPDFNIIFYCRPQKEDMKIQWVDEEKNICKHRNEVDAVSFFVENKNGSFTKVVLCAGHLKDLVKNINEIESEKVPDQHADL